MNPGVVTVDASIAVKWVVTVEDFATHAQVLLRDCVQAGRPVVGPPHLHGEVANALYQRTRSQEPDRQLTEHEAAEALRTFLTLPVAPLSPAGLHEAAFFFARAHALPSVYDSLYVVLAQLLGGELWTADRRLLDALGSSTPWVHFIGDYPIT